jgi:hypothetical protein
VMRVKCPRHHESVSANPNRNSGLRNSGSFLTVIARAPCVTTHLRTDRPTAVTASSVRWQLERRAKTYALLVLETRRRVAISTLGSDWR